jgi:mono/diheme cytochrome c family protein
MNLLKNDATTPRSQRTRRWVGLSLFSVGVVALTGMGCARHESASRASETTTVAMAPTGSAAADSVVTTVSTGETTLSPAAPTTAPAPEAAIDSPPPAKAAHLAAATKHGAKPDSLAVTPSEYDGWKMFHVYCYRCHGVDAMGGTFAPNLRHSVSSQGTVTHDVFLQTVTWGRTGLGMPSWRELLDTTQMNDIYHYLLARSSGRLLPGRPHIGTPPK